MSTTAPASSPVPLTRSRTRPTPLVDASPSETSPPLESSSSVGAHHGAPVRIVIVGHVDHGKSTLIGRLFHDTGSLPEGKLEAIQTSCETRGVPFEWAFLMDAFKAERDQNITIDTAQIWFKSEARSYVIIDAPGHREFLKNMVTGAASADAAVLVVAADEGVCDQSRRHAYLLSLLGVKDVIVVVNKIDLVDSPKDAFNTIETELGAFMRDLGLSPQGFIAVSARDGDNIVQRTPRVAFREGPTLVEALDAIPPPQSADTGPLRLPVQDIYRFDHRRIIAGRIESGSVSVGDTIVFEPGGRRTTVRSLEGWAKPTVTTAHAGESVGLVLEDQLFVERGQVAALATAPKPPAVTRSVTARIFWMGQAPLSLGQRLKIKLATQQTTATVSRIDFSLDSSSLSRNEEATKIARDEVAQVQLTFDRAVALDIADDVTALGRFVLVDGYDVSGGGLVLKAEADIGQHAGDDEADAVSPAERTLRFGHAAHLVTVAAPSAASGHAFAQRLERDFFARGIHAVALAPDSPLEAITEAASLRRSGAVVIAVAAGAATDAEVEFPTDVEVHVSAADFASIAMGENGERTEVEAQQAAATIAAFWASKKGPSSFNRSTNEVTA